MDENSNSRSSSDSVDVSHMESSPPLINGHIETEQFSDEDNGLTSLQIIEQPQQRGFRFRYECEGPSHGGLQGATSERHRRTVPTLKIRNYSGSARVVVSLVTDEGVPRAHAHKLVGKNCQNGVCVMDVKAGTSQISFPNLCIQHVTRRKAAEVLEQRICNAMIDEKKRQTRDWNSQIKLTGDDIKKAKQEAAGQAKGMLLNVVRLCFQCYLTNAEGTILTELPSIVSDPIYDSKAPGANALKICRMDKYSGCCTGNDEVFLLCEKVQKDDIMVRFLEQDLEGNPVWEAYGNFGPFDVHRQFAIVFKTPEYRDVNIQTPVNVLVMLQRKSDGESSEPKSFTYYPRIRDKEDIDRKRRKLLPTYNHGGGGFTGMKHSVGGSGNGNNGSEGSNGMHNGGSIPNFDNLPLSANQFGQRPLNLNSSGRPVLQAKRTLPSYNQSVGPALYSGAPTNVLSQSADYLYEEVSNLSPPMAQLQGIGSPQYVLEGQGQTMVVGSQDDSSMSVASPYNGRTMMAGSPQSLVQTSVPQFGAGALSPQHQLHSSSAQNNFISQQMIASSQVQGIPVSESVLSSIQNAQVESELQMTINDLKIEPVSQPVQVSPLSSENLEVDFLIQNAQLSSMMNTGFDQYNQMANQFTENKNIISYGGGYSSQQPFMQQTCSYSARGSQDNDLQDVIEVLDLVDGAPPRAEPCEDYDEVDSARVDTFDMSGLTPRSGTATSKLLEQTAKFEPGVTKAVTVSKDEVKPEPYTKLLEEKTVTTQPEAAGKLGPEPAVNNKNNVTIETRVEVESPQKTTTAAQTEMDPMLKLAMKTSEALQYYAASGDIRSLLMVQRFLMAVQDQDGDLPLHTALINQRYEVFQNILDVMVTLPDAYARVNAYNFHHQTPLHLAVITNQAHAVDLLIRAGADTTLVDRNGYTPAHLAVLYERTECLKNLLKYLRQGVSSKEPFPELNFRCYDGFTPAHLAAQLDNLAAMKLLVYGKANVDLPDGKSGRTPLHHAVENDDLSLAAYLILQTGANVNAKRFDGNTALHIACGRGNVSLVALLMAGGADPNIENDEVEEVSDEAEPDESDSQESSEESVENDNVDSKNNAVTDDVEDKDMDTEKEPKKKSENQDVMNRKDLKERRSFKKKIGRGLTPADFADSNDKILRVLNGEPYSSITETSSDSVQNVTDKLSSLRFISKDSGHGSMGVCTSGGDMCRVPYSVRLDLSEKLDPASTGTDWQALADKLGMKMLMEGHLGDNSPTRVLLTLYEEGGGTVDRLVQALTDLKRDDCVSLLRNLVDQSTEQSQDIETKAVNKDPKFDSGVSDSYNKPYSPEHRAHIVT